MSRSKKTLSAVFGDMEEYTLLDIFNGKSLRGIIPKGVCCALETVLNEPDLSKDFFYKADVLTRAVYGNNGVCIIAQPVPGYKGLPKICYLGDQESVWHVVDKKISRHTSFTAGGLIEIGKKGIIDAKIAAVIGALHDVGKKYTAHASANGLSFYGHAQLSALIAWHWLNKLNLFSEEERKAIVAAIYGHDIVKQQIPAQKKKYYESLDQLGNKINRMNTEYCEALVKADSGIVAKEENGEYSVLEQEYSPTKGKILEEKTKVSKRRYNRLVRLGRTTIDSIVA